MLNRLCQMTLMAMIVAGCSNRVELATDLNTDALQDQLATGILEQTGVVVTVTCPKHIPLQKGYTFECAVIAPDGSSSHAAVTQSDNQGNVVWEVKP
jgi:hypothetical protein